MAVSVKGKALKRLAVGVGVSGFLTPLLFITLLVPTFFSMAESSNGGVVDPAIVANQEYASNAFIYEAKKRGWKKDAIIGTLAYTLAENNQQLGTFTYESYTFHKGPSGVAYDTTMDNGAWLKWLDGSGLNQAVQSYSTMSGVTYAAIGVGIFADSDVWVSRGAKTVTRATTLINYAESKGRPWQDPETQMTYYFDVAFKDYDALFDYDDGVHANPKKDNRTADEWCRRVTAGYGMPGWVWTTNSALMLAHTSRVPLAQRYYDNYRDFEYVYADGGDEGGILSTDGVTINFNSKYYTFASNGINGNPCVCDASNNVAWPYAECMTQSYVGHWNKMICSSYASGRYWEVNYPNSNFPLPTNWDSILTIEKRAPSTGKFSRDVNHPISKAIISISFNGVLHDAFIEGVGADGSVVISETNVCTDNQYGFRVRKFRSLQEFLNSYGATLNGMYGK